ncbi:hypothetical protein [Rhodococcus marinonascens]|uniref:hypothetical protein n=1 Tax=Rhodococcus marinonascens TaxID=38311 RepID=UPI0009FD0A2D|nr:hypothetical protein [Rhodococcus marinonascens]
MNNSHAPSRRILPKIAKIVVAGALVALPLGIGVAPATAAPVVSHSAHSTELVRGPEGYGGPGFHPGPGGYGGQGFHPGPPGHFSGPGFGGPGYHPGHGY